MIKVSFTDLQGQPHSYESEEGFEVSTNNIYPLVKGKRGAGFQAEWDPGSRTWYVYGFSGFSGTMNGAHFSAEEGLEVSAQGRKPTYAGEEISLYGKTLAQRDGLVAFAYDGPGEIAACDPYGWAEAARWSKDDPGRKPTLRIRPQGSWSGRKLRKQVVLAATPRERLSALAERQAA